MWQCAAVRCSALGVFRCEEVFTCLVKRSVCLHFCVWGLLQCVAVWCGVQIYFNKAPQNKTCIVLRMCTNMYAVHMSVYTQSTHCNSLQHTATHCKTLQHTMYHLCIQICYAYECVHSIFSVQHTATHCNPLQHTAAHCSTLQHTAANCECTQTRCNALQRTTTYCNILQRTATQCNTLHHTASHCITLHYTTPHCNRPHTRSSQQPG